SLPVRIGQQIPWSNWFDAQSSARELTGRCYQHLEQLRKGLPGRFKTESAIARPEDRALLKRELHKAECLGRTADGKAIYL
ncbi:GNAT family N-acetyltransferase, partial [Escherichia coli]|nr:GNAT family N-acetyltransferase [Escherichia coli]